MVRPSRQAWRHCGSTKYSIEIEQVANGDDSSGSADLRAVLRPARPERTSAGPGDALPDHGASPDSGRCAELSSDNDRPAYVPGAGARDDSWVDDDDDDNDNDNDNDEDDDNDDECTSPALADDYEETFLFRRSTKADRRAGTAGGGSGRPRAVNRGERRRRERSDRKDNSAPRRARRFRRKEKREEERAAQLEARKKESRRTRESLGTGREGGGGGYCWAERIDTSSPSRGNYPGGALGIRRPGSDNACGGGGRPRRQQRYTPKGGQVEILSAEELGIENGAMYGRLLRILEGEEITPEDFDLLLQLDSKNAKSTMEASEVSEFAELLTVEPGPGPDGTVSGTAASIGSTFIQREDLKDQQCIICLAPFENLPDGAQLRRLPCKHMYCRDCIDQWLTKNSARCPNLSCFWALPTDGAT
mmetsp:Transcript_20641/g.59949  ORF Transcript_20641/g.59949 Transcript_20641/m.59949 type:complete len:419 (-) Transcript_20641:121-1377(-)